MPSNCHGYTDKRRRQMVNFLNKGDGTNWNHLIAYSNNKNRPCLCWANGLWLSLRLYPSMDIRLLIFKNEGLDKVNDLLGPLYVENSMILWLFHLFLHHWSFSIYFLWEGNKEIFTWKIWNFILLSPKLDFETGKEGGPLTEGINIGFDF